MFCKKILLPFISFTGMSVVCITFYYLCKIFLSFSTSSLMIALKGNIRYQLLKLLQYYLHIKYICYSWIFKSEGSRYWQTIKNKEHPGIYNKLQKNNFVGDHNIYFRKHKKIPRKHRPYKGSAAIFQCFLGQQYCKNLM